MDVLICRHLKRNAEVYCATEEAKNATPCRVSTESSDLLIS